MKAVVAAFNQEKALVGAFSVIVQIHRLIVIVVIVDTFSHYYQVSLPEEVGDMSSLMELDVSCNEIAHLPVQIGDLAALRSLHLRRNHLQVTFVYL